VYVYVVWQALDGRLTVGDVALYGGGAAMLHGRLLVISRMMGLLPSQWRFLPALDRVLSAPPDLPLPAHPRPVPRPIRQGIRFDGVCFTYPGPTSPVLRGVSFAIRPGESVALVGHNGAGKTTIVKLLLRLYDPTKGRILLDGVDLREYDLDALRRRMGVIFQDYVRYELTARENVAAGNLAALADDRRLLKAVRQAGGSDLLNGLPRGLDTQLGRQFGGRELSGGEWQKLALARAFVRDCDLLVLDEPTAALDVQTEYDVYLRFQELTQGQMTLLISHRFSTVRMAGRILYLDAGQIAEAGSHEALMQHGGEYARLYRLQASQYLDGRQVKEPVG
ncbi:MAG: ABC transporter ATP-binding protein, partial [Chloroflexota bacterium]